MSSDTKTRVLTASWLLPATLLSIFFLPDLYFSLLIGLVLLFATKEWSGLNSFDKTKTVFFALFCIGLYLSVLFLFSEVNTVVLMIGVILWLLLPIWLYKYEIAKVNNKPNAFTVFVVGLPVLVCGFYSIAYIRNMFGSDWLLLLLLIIWIADSAAYFCGRKWGTKKLAPRLSPGKSWEGVFSAIVFSTIFIFVSMYWFEVQHQDKLVFFLMGIAIIIFSVIGDLFESMIKRLNNKKDSGTILPGHGGILDRIDSLLSTAPIFALGLFYLHG